jgi:hypothetical protein
MSASSGLFPLPASGSYHVTRSWWSWCEQQEYYLKVTRHNDPHNRYPMDQAYSTILGSRVYHYHTRISTIFVV